MQYPLSYCTMCGDVADKKVRNIAKFKWLPYCGPHSKTLMKILEVLGVAYMVIVEDIK